jgi:hypothetical protein
MMQYITALKKKYLGTGQHCFSDGAHPISGTWTGRNMLMKVNSKTITSEPDKSTGLTPDPSKLKKGKMFLSGCFGGSD